jgi:hypothetical protein
MEVYRSEIQTIYYYEDKSLMKVVVSPETEYIGDENYQEAQWKEVAMIRKYRPSKMIINVQDLRYTLPPEMQEWTAQNIAIPMIQLCVKRAAYIIPVDFYAQLSIEQLVTELPEMNYITMFFQDERTAMEWLESYQ